MKELSFPDGLEVEHWYSSFQLAKAAAGEAESSGKKMLSWLPAKQAVSKANIIAGDVETGRTLPYVKTVGRWFQQVCTASEQDYYSLWNSKSGDT